MGIGVGTTVEVGIGVTVIGGVTRGKNVFELHPAAIDIIRMRPNFSAFLVSLSSINSLDVLAVFSQPG